MFLSLKKNLLISEKKFWSQPIKDNVVIGNPNDLVYLKLWDWNAKKNLNP